MTGPVIKAASREAMVEQVVKAGMSRTDAAILTDLSNHACDEAMAAIMRVTDTAPPGMKIAVVTSALASVAGVLRDKFPEHWKALVASVQEEDVIVLPDLNKGGAS